MIMNRINSSKPEQKQGKSPVSSEIKGFISISKRLLVNLLEDKENPEFILAYISILAKARHQLNTDSVSGLRHAELQISDRQLMSQMNFTDRQCRNFFNWMQRMNFSSTRRLSGQRVLLLTQYDAHTLSGGFRHKEKSEQLNLFPQSDKFDNEELW